MANMKPVWEFWENVIHPFIPKTLDASNIVPRKNKLNSLLRYWDLPNLFEENYIPVAKSNFDDMNLFSVRNNFDQNMDRFIPNKPFIDVHSNKLIQGMEGLQEIFPIEKTSPEVIEGIKSFLSNSLSSENKDSLFRTGMPSFKQSLVSLLGNQLNFPDNRGYPIIDRINDIDTFNSFSPIQRDPMDLITTLSKTADKYIRPFYDKNPLIRKNPYFDPNALNISDNDMFINDKDIML